MQPRYVCAIGVLAIVGLPPIAAGADPVQRFKTDAFSRTADLKALPPAVVLALSQFCGGGAMASSGEPLEATDAISDRTLPRRRLIDSGTSGDLTFVEYEHGGRGLHQHFVLFQTNEGQATPVNACSGFLPRGIKKLRKVVGTSACRWKSSEDGA
jgi:hypothetical protein